MFKLNLSASERRGSSSHNVKEPAPTISNVFRDAIRESRDPNGFNMPGNHLIASNSQCGKEIICRKCKCLVLDEEEDMNDVVQTRVTSVIDKLRNKAKKRRDAVKREALDEILARIDVIVAKNRDMFEPIAIKSVGRAANNILKQNSQKSDKDLSEELIKITDSSNVVKIELMAEMQTWFESAHNEWEEVMVSLRSSTLSAPSNENLQDVLTIVEKFADTINQLEKLVTSNLASTMSYAHNLLLQYQKSINDKPKPVESNENLSATDSKDSLFDLSLDNHIREIVKIIPDNGEENLPGDVPSALKIIIQTLNLGKRTAKTKALKKAFSWGRKRLKVISAEHLDREKKVVEIQKELDAQKIKFENEKRKHESEKKTYEDKLAKVEKDNAELTQTVVDLQESLEASLAQNQFFDRKPSSNELMSVNGAYNDVGSEEFRILESKMAFDSKMALSTPCRSRSIKLTHSDPSLASVVMSGERFPCRRSMDIRRQEMEFFMAQENEQLQLKRKEMEEQICNFQLKIQNLESDCNEKDKEIDNLKNEPRSKLTSESVIRDRCELEAKVAELERMCLMKRYSSTQDRNNGSRIDCSPNENPAREDERDANDSPDDEPVLSIKQSTLHKQVWTYRLRTQLEV